MATLYTCPNGHVSIRTKSRIGKLRCNSCKKQLSEKRKTTNTKLKRDLDKITDRISHALKSGNLTSKEQDKLTQAQQELLDLLN